MQIKWQLYVKLKVTADCALARHNPSLPDVAPRRVKSRERGLWKDSREHNASCDFFEVI